MPVDGGITPSMFWRLEARGRKLETAGQMPPCRRAANLLAWWRGEFEEEFLDD
jgi:hypothetical protein